MADETTSVNIERELLGLTENLLKARKRALADIEETINLEKLILEYTKKTGIQYNSRTKTIGSINKELTLAKEIEGELYSISNRRYYLESNINGLLSDIVRKEQELLSVQQTFANLSVRETKIMQEMAELREKEKNKTIKKREAEEKIKELKKEQESIGKTLSDGAEKYIEKLKKQKESFEQQLNRSIELLEIDRKRTRELERQQDKLNAQLNFADKISGGWLNKLKNNDLSKILGVDKLITKLNGVKLIMVAITMGIIKKGIDNFLSFDKAATQVRKNLGLLRGEAQKIEENIKRVTLESMRLGGTFEQTAKVVKEIAEAFTGYSTENKEFVKTLNTISLQLEIAASESSEFLKTMAGIKNESAEANLYILGFARKVSEASRIPLSTVMKDAANAARNSSAYIKPTAEYMTVAAAKARMMGTTLENMANTSRKLLDFQTSIQDELDASVLLGRNVNFQRARELAYRKDTVAANEEIVRQAKRYRFDMMDPFQMEAFAKAAGKTVGELQDMYEASKRMDELERMSLTDDKLKTRLNALKQMQDMRKEEAKDLGKQALLELERRENQERIASLQQKFNAFLSKVSEPAMKLAEVLLEIATKILPPILNGILGIIDTFKIVAAIDFFKGINLSFFKTFKLLFSFTTFFSGLKMLFLNPFTALNATIGKTISLILNIDYSFKRAAVSLMKIINNIKETFQSPYKVIETFILKWSTKIEKFFSTFKIPFIDKLSKSDFFVKTLPAIIKRIEIIFSSFKNIKFFNFILEKTKDFLNFIKILYEGAKASKFFAETIPTIIAKIKPFFSFLSKIGESFKFLKFLKLGGKAIPFVGEVIMAIEALYITFKRAKDIFGNFIDGIKEIFSGNFLKGLGLIGKGMLKSLLLPVELVVDVIGGAIYDLVQLILGWVGIELPEGIWNGFEALGDKIFDSLLSPFKSAWKWIKGIYVGESPSFLSKGILKGIIAVGKSITKALIEPFKSPEKIILFLLKLPFIELLNWMPMLLKNIINIVINPFKNIKNTISNYLKESFDTIYTDGLAKINKLENVVSKSPLLNVIPIVGDIKMAKDIADLINNSISSKNKEISSDISQPIIDGLNGAVDKSKESYNKIQVGLEAIKPELRQSLVEPFSDAWDDVDDKWGGKSPSKIGNSILVGIQSIVDSMYNNLINPFKAASATIDDEFTNEVPNNILTNINNINLLIYNSLISPFKEGFNYIVSDFKNIISILLNTINKNNIQDLITNQISESFPNAIKASIVSSIKESFDLISLLGSYVSESIVAEIQNSQIEIYYNLIDPFITAFDFIESKWFELIDSIKSSIDFDKMINNQIELYNSLIVQFIDVVYLIEGSLNKVSQILIDQKNKISDSFINSSIFNNLIDTLTINFEILIDNILNSIANYTTTISSNILNSSLVSFFYFSKEIGNYIIDGIINNQSSIYESLIYPFLDAFNFIEQEWIKLISKFTIPVNLDNDGKKVELELNKSIKQPFNNIVNNINGILFSLLRTIFIPVNINFVLTGLNDISENLYTSLIDPIKNIKTQYEKILKELILLIQVNFDKIEPIEPDNILNDSFINKTDEINIKLENILKSLSNNLSILTDKFKNEMNSIKIDISLNESFLNMFDNIKIKLNDLLNILSNKPIKINDSFKNEIEKMSFKINKELTQPVKLDDSIVLQLDVISKKIKELSMIPVKLDDSIVLQLDVISKKIKELSTRPFRLDDSIISQLDLIKEKINEISTQSIILNGDVVNEPFFNKLLETFDLGFLFLTKQFRNFITIETDYLYFEIYNALIQSFDDAFEQILLNTEKNILDLSNKIKLINIDFLGDKVIDNVTSMFYNITSYFSNILSENILNNIINIQEDLYLALIDPFEKGFEWIKNNWTNTLLFLLNKTVTSTISIIDDAILTKLIDSLNVISNLYLKDKNESILSSLSNELNFISKLLINTVDLFLPELINLFNKLININFNTIIADISRLSNVINSFAMSISKIAIGFDNKFFDNLNLLSGFASSIERTNIALSTIADDLLIFKDKEIVDGINNITNAINKLNDAVDNINKVKINANTSVKEESNKNKNENTTDDKIASKLDEFISLIKNGSIAVNMDGVKTGQLMTLAAKYRS